MLRSKKGDLQQEIILHAIDFVILVAFLLICLQIVDGIEENRVFDKNFLAKDLALTASVVAAAPEDISTIYDPGAFDSRLSYFDYVFEDHKMTVITKQGVKVYAPYSYPEQAEAKIPNVVKPESLFFEKIGNAFYISLTPHDLPERKDLCDGVQKVQKAPLHITSGTGLTDLSAYPDAAEVEFLALDVQDTLILAGLQIQQYLDEGTLFISLQPGISNDEIQPITIHFTANTRGIACGIRNMFQNDLALQSWFSNQLMRVTMHEIPSNIDEADIRATEAKGVVVIELGNVAAYDNLFSTTTKDNTQPYRKTVQDIADGIKEGIE
ncbi:hypothetical protein H6504_03530 [Candidatus Woesearchaeota archaeon]|nr:hypothetical protein [Candidatus Woesearchaeota archaeon]